MHPLRSLLAGDEAAFRTLVLRYHRSLVRVALSFVRSESVAEEVTQETWLAVMWGLRKFEGRSSLKTWIFHILINQARSRGVKEQRSVPFSALDPEPGEQPTVDPGRFAEMSEQMRCNLVVELLTDYIEGALDDATAQRGDDHLAICPPCVVFLADDVCCPRSVVVRRAASSDRRGARERLPAFGYRDSGAAGPLNPG